MANLSPRQTNSSNRGTANLSAGGRKLFFHVALALMPAKLLLFHSCESVSHASLLLQAIALVNNVTAGRRLLILLTPFRERP